MKVKDLIRLLKQCNPESVLAVPVLTVEEVLNGYDGYANELIPHGKYKGKLLADVPEEEFHDYMNSCTYEQNKQTVTQVYIETLSPTKFIKTYDPSSVRLRMPGRKNILIGKLINEYADSLVNSNIRNDRLEEVLQDYAKQDKFLKDNLQEIIGNIKRKRGHIALTTLDRIKPGPTRRFSDEERKQRKFESNKRSYIKRRSDPEKLEQMRISARERAKKYRSKQSEETKEKKRKYALKRYYAIKKNNPGQTYKWYLNACKRRGKSPKLTLEQYIEKHKND